VALTHLNCPECERHVGGYEDLQMVFDRIIQIKLCMDCGTQWTIEYGNPIVKEVHNES